MASTTPQTGATSMGAAEQGEFQERTLIVSNIAAHFVKDKDLIGSQDPYFTLELSGDTVTTSVQKSGGTDCKWPEEEGYRLHDRGEHPELHIKAWNKNTLLRDSVLGEGNIAMAELGVGQTHTVPLFDKKGAEAGEIKFWAKEEAGSGPPRESTGPGAGTATGAAGAAGAGAAAGKKARDEKVKHDKSRDTESNTGQIRDEGATGTQGSTGQIRDAGVAQTYDNTQQAPVDNNAHHEAMAAGAGGIANAKGADTGDNTRNVTGSETYTDGNNTGRDEAALGAGAAAAGAAAGAGAVTTTRSSKTTTDTNTNESEEYRRTGGGGALNLESGDDHWEKSLAAAAEARRQAQLVEAASQDTHTKMLAAQEATRNFEKARREHMAIQDRLAALDLDSKRARFEQSTAAYEAAKGKLGGKAQEVDAAQQQANALRAEVNEKGEALDAQVSETKLHQSRLAELEAEIERLTGLHRDADNSHRRLIADLDPKKKRHATLQEEFQRVQAELTDAQRRRAALEAQEHELEAQLNTHNSEYESSRGDLADLEAMGRNKDAEAEARRNDAAGLEAELIDVQSHLAEHRKRIGLLKQDTEAAVVKADKLSAAADAKTAELAASQQTVGQREQEAGAAQAALNQAQTSVEPLYEKVRHEKTEVDHQKSVVEELHRKLGAAKEAVDLAQARKEEMWHKAKQHGEEADKHADKHFLASHADHRFATGHDTYDASKMTTAGSTTREVLRNAGDQL